MLFDNIRKTPVEFGQHGRQSKLNPTVHVPENAIPLAEEFWGKPSLWLVPQRAENEAEAQSITRS